MLLDRLAQDRALVERQADQHHPDPVLGEKLDDKLLPRVRQARGPAMGSKVDRDRPGLLVATFGAETGDEFGGIVVSEIRRSGASGRGRGCETDGFLGRKRRNLGRIHRQITRRRRIEHRPQDLLAETRPRPALAADQAQALALLGLGDPVLELLALEPWVETRKGCGVVGIGVQHLAHPPIPDRRVPRSGKLRAGPMEPADQFGIVELDPLRRTVCGQRVLAARLHMRADRGDFDAAIEFRPGLAGLEDHLDGALVNTRKLAVVIHAAPAGHSWGRVRQVQPSSATMLGVGNLVVVADQRITADEAHCPAALL